MNSQIKDILLDLSSKYGFNSDEAMNYVESKYFQNDFVELLNNYSKMNIFGHLLSRTALFLV
jgi:hypothetical protein